MLSSNDCSLKFRIPVQKLNENINKYKFSVSTFLLICSEAMFSSLFRSLLALSITTFPYVSAL